MRPRRIWNSATARCSHAGVSTEGSGANSAAFSVQLEIVADGAVVAAVLANRHRDDLLAAGLGSGRHAFRVPLRRPGTRIDVRRVTDHAVVPGSPIWCS